MKTNDHVTDHATDHGCDVSLIEQLKSIPLESREWIKNEAGLGLRNMPSGRYCQKAAESLQKAKAEVERLTGRMQEAEDIIKGLHDGWKKARKAHLATCKNAQAEIDKLHTENVCLQELIQEFYEWTRRDFPTEQEVREIMDRYHNLLNK